MGAADDVDVVAQRHSRKLRDDGLSMLGHPINGRHRRKRFRLEGQQRHREKLGEDDEVGTVIGGELAFERALASA